MAREAIELHLEGLIEEGEAIPLPTSVEQCLEEADYRNGTWAMVTIDSSSLRLRAKRVNVTMPERVLEAVDRYAAREGETRSGLLVRAVTEYMGRAPAKGDRTKR